MTTTDAAVMASLLEMLEELAGDWEYDGEVRPDTRFVAELGLESLEIVVLGTLLQQRYGKLPFSEFLEELGQRPVEERDLTVAELVAFVCEHRPRILEGA